MDAQYLLENISYRYQLGSQFVDALCAIELKIEAGEFLAIAGPSGSGKTTLLNLLGLLDRPWDGTIRYNGQDVSNLSERECTLLRREQIGFIFQSFNLIPTLTAYENVEYFLLKRSVAIAQVRERVFQALEAVGISEQAGKFPYDMSGGQRQRVAIARALVRNPKVVIADEPTASLDQKTGLAAISLMRRQNREQGTTFVFSTHDPKVLAEADRVVQLSDGRIVQ
jgi:putative ABC transport system ATP-binding protein